jgi:hypothetical protein
LTKQNQYSTFDGGDFIPKNREYECTKGAQPLWVWVFLDAYSLVKVAAWQSSNIGCFFCCLFLEIINCPDRVISKKQNEKSGGNAK